MWRNIDICITHCTTIIEIPDSPLQVCVGGINLRALLVKLNPLIISGINSKRYQSTDTRIHTEVSVAQYTKIPTKTVRDVEVHRNIFSILISLVLISRNKNVRLLIRKFIF